MGVLPRRASRRVDLQHQVAAVDVEWREGTYVLRRLQVLTPEAGHLSLPVVGEWVGDLVGSAEPEQSLLYLVAGDFFFFFFFYFRFTSSPSQDQGREEGAIVTIRWLLGP
jgi:hypothetical protein